MLASAFFASHPALSLVAALSSGVTSALGAPLVASTSASTILRNAQRSTTWADAIAGKRSSSGTGSGGSFELGFSQRRTQNRHTQDGGHSKRASARRQQQQGSDLTAPLYNLDDARWAC